MNKKNFWGKTLLEAKKIGEAVSKSASEISESIGEATSNAKNLAKISMLKAERDDLYMKLGKAVFENGVTTDNEIAVACINEITKKNEEIATLEKETKANNKENVSDETEDNTLITDADCAEPSFLNDTNSETEEDN